MLTIKELFSFVNPFRHRQTVEGNHISGSLVPTLRFLSHLHRVFYYLWGITEAKTSGLFLILALQVIHSGYPLGGKT